MVRMETEPVQIICWILISKSTGSFMLLRIYGCNILSDELIIDKNSEGEVCFDIGREIID